jgi:hypothetical protein
VPDPVASPALIDLSLDPRRANQVAIFGRKGQGKSELAHYYWAAFPGDRICIDITGDVWTKHPVEGAIKWGYGGSDPSLEGLPSRFPTPDVNFDGTRERVTVFYKPDPGSATYKNDIDHAIGLAYAHEGCMCWVEEIAEVAPASKTFAHMRRALHQGRHQRLNLLMTGPRPKDINVLCLANADIVACFDLPNPDDRKRVADSVGLPQAVVDDAIASLKDHEYFAYTAVPRAYAVMPPLPLKERRSKRSA